MRKNTRTSFWSNVDIRDLYNCWDWQGTLCRGYGQFRMDNSRYSAHRLAWEFTHNMVIPTGSLVLHRCDNPACVNPSHLYLGSASDNLKDAYARKRKDHHGERHPSAKLKDFEAKQIFEWANLGVNQHILAMAFGVARPTISDIKTGRRWRHLRKS